MTTRVYFDFENEATAEAFGDAVSEWLCQRVPAPRDLAEKARETFDQVISLAIPRCPRYWLYEDASASSETTSPPVERKRVSYARLGASILIGNVSVLSYAAVRGWWLAVGLASLGICMGIWTWVSAVSVDRSSQTEEGR